LEKMASTPVRPRKKKARPPCRTPTPRD
jgi:hypothetical protein